MVYYFTSNVVDPQAFIYVGKDKEESRTFLFHQYGLPADLSRDEDLIAHGWPEDVWFHADNLSSAHIYLRLPNPETEPWTAISQDLLTDCAQLTKANSIEGNKKDNVTVVYTPWSNLKKTGDMATGQVGFHQQKLVKKIRVEKRENAIVNRLNKTKVEKNPDFRMERADRDAEERKRERMSAQEKVCCNRHAICNPEANNCCRRRTTRGLRKSEPRSNTKRSICTMSCTRRRIWLSPATRTAMRTSKTTLCDAAICLTFPK